MRFPCLEINTLSEFVMIAGSDELLEFELFYKDAEPINLEGSTVMWTLAPYGQLDYTVCEIPGKIILPNKFTVNLTTSDTIDLEHGKYIQQPVVIDVTGEENRLGQGIITILSQIPLS